MKQAPLKIQPPADTAKKVRTVIWVLIGVLVAAGLVWFAVLTATKPPTSLEAVPADSARLVREDSHRITAPDTEKAQLVEFLDFECKPCRALSPLVEELKKEYGDRITFVQRHFPLSMHRNSRTSAVAVEAAAQQGKYEQMVAMMWDKQAEWGDKQESQAALFRTYAQDLDLDMTRYDADVLDEKTKEKIDKDVADGAALGVTGTPTFFLDGKKLTLNSEEQFRQYLEDAAK